MKQEINIDYAEEVKVNYSETDDNRYFSCHIQKYDIYFSCLKEKGINEIKQRAKILVESWINMMQTENNRIIVNGKKYK